MVKDNQFKPNIPKTYEQFILEQPEQDQAVADSYSAEFDAYGDIGVQKGYGPVHEFARECRQMQKEYERERKRSEEILGVKYCEGSCSLKEIPKGERYCSECKEYNEKVGGGLISAGAEKGGQLIGEIATGGSKVGGEIFKEFAKDVEGKIGYGTTSLFGGYHLTHQLSGKNYDPDCDVCNP